MPPQGRLGDKAAAPVDVHGCVGCPHSVQGPAVTGSNNVLVNNKPALRATDRGIHGQCCGPNTWVATLGSPTVLINYLPAHRQGDLTTHCGGVGQLIEGSEDVLVG